MGSTITLINDTPNQWHCNLAGDQKLLGFIYTAAYTLSTALTVTAVIACYLPTFAGLSVGGAPFLGLEAGTAIQSIRTIEAASFITAGFTGLAGNTDNFIRTLEDDLYKQKFQVIPPNGSYTWRNMRPLIWHQSTCVQYQKTNENSVHMEELVLRPLFASLKRKKDSIYSIKKYLNNRKSNRKVVQRFGPDEPVPANWNRPEMFLANQKKTKGAEIMPTKGTGDWSGAAQSVAVLANPMPVKSSETNQYQDAPVLISMPTSESTRVFIDPKEVTNGQNVPVDAIAA